MNIKTNDMKNIQLVVVSVITLTVILTSCKKWLDYDPHEDYKITELDYLQSESDYKTMTISVYTPLQWLNQAVPVGDIASDNAGRPCDPAGDHLSV